MNPLKWPWGTWLKRWRLWVGLTAVLGILALCVCWLMGWFDEVLAFLGIVALGGVLGAQSVLDQTGKAAGFSPLDEVPDRSRRQPGGPISPPEQRDDPEAIPMNPSRRGSD